MRAKTPSLLVALLFFAAFSGEGLEARNGRRWDPSCNCWAPPPAPVEEVEEEPAAECPADPIADAIGEMEGMASHDGYFNLHLGEDDEIWLEVPSALLGRLFLVVGTVARGDGNFQLLHMPLGDQAYEFRLNHDNERLDLVIPRLDPRISPDSPLATAFEAGTWDGIISNTFETLATRPVPPDDLPAECLDTEEGEEGAEGEESAEGEEGADASAEGGEGEPNLPAPPAEGTAALAVEAGLALAADDEEAGEEAGEVGEEYADPISGTWQGHMVMTVMDYTDKTPMDLVMELAGEDVTGTMDSGDGHPATVAGTFSGDQLHLEVTPPEDEMMEGFSMEMTFDLRLVASNHLKGTWRMVMEGEGMSEEMDGKAEFRRGGGGGDEVDPEDVEAYLIDVTEWVTAGMGGGLDGFTRIISAAAYPENLEIEMEGMQGFGGYIFGGAVSLPGMWNPAVAVHYSMALLPEEPMVARAADDRVGYFTTDYLDMGVETTDNNIKRLAHRWRLEKADPDAEVSDPITPITFYVDPTVPEQWRPYVAKGIENWSKAYAAAGFSNAIRAVLPGAEDWPEDYAAADVRYSSVSWAPAESAVFAIGPSNVDPRSGEIVNADIVFTHGWIRAWTQDYELEGSPIAAVPTYEEARAAYDSLQSLPAAERQRYCALLDPLALGDTSPHLLRLALMAEGLLAPGESTPEEFIGEALVEVTMHEVGHTIGLRHNFKSSSGVPWERLNDVAYTREHGLTSSVMDYASANINSDRDNQGDHYSHVVGDYDVWAIQYGYTPLAGEEIGTQHPWLADLAARSAEPGLAYGTDEDSASPFGWDPLTNYFDLSGDPISYYEDRLALVASLQDSLVERTVSEGEDWSDLRGGVLTLMYEVYNGGSYVAKAVGGHEMSRSHRGDPDAPAPITVTSGADQRRALALIARILAGDEMVPAAESYPYLVDTFWAWGRGARSGWGVNIDIHAAVRRRKMAVVANLFDVDRVVRIRDNAWAAPAGTNPVTMAEVVDTVTAAIWGDDLAASPPPDSFAQGLQAEYIDFLISNLSGWYRRSPDLEVLALTTLLEIRDSIREALEAGGQERLVAAHYTAVELKITTLLEWYGIVAGGAF